VALGMVPAVAFRVGKTKIGHGDQPGQRKGTEPQVLARPVIVCSLTTVADKKGSKAFKQQ